MLSEYTIEVYGMIHIRDTILRQEQDVYPLLFIVSNQVATNLIDSL